MIYRFTELSSTNDEAVKACYGEGDVIVAERQTAGRGQRGHKWESEESQNLTFTLILEPTFLAPERQFLLSEAVALGVSDMLEEYGITAQIKWTNDIYVSNRKVAGILIEHKLQGAGIARTIAGVGLNVNQMSFPSELPNPISMRQVRRFEFDREEVLESLIKHLMARYEQLRRGEEESLQEDYHNHLYRLGALHWYALPDGRCFRGTIRGVEPSGALRIEDEKRVERSFLFKEVEFMLSR